MLSNPNFSECLSIYIQECSLLISQSTKTSKQIHTQPRHLRMSLKSLLQPKSRSLCTIVSPHHINALWSLSIPYFLKNSIVSKRKTNSLFYNTVPLGQVTFPGICSRTILEGFNVLFLSCPSPFRQKKTN